MRILVEKLINFIYGRFCFIARRYGGMTDATNSICDIQSILHRFPCSILALTSGSGIMYYAFDHYGSIIEESLQTRNRGCPHFEQSRCSYLPTLCGIYK